MDRVILITAFIICAITIFIVVYIADTTKQEKHVNKVHFYVARDKGGGLYLYFGKPIRAYNIFMVLTTSYAILLGNNFEKYGLNPSKYDNLKWEDEPVEVFLNLED